MIFSIRNNISAIPEGAIQKFWDKVLKGEVEQNCWSFNSMNIKNNKYIFRYDGDSYRAHIISFLIKNPTITIQDGYYVQSNCGTISCINPDHLQLEKRTSGKTDKYNNSNHPWRIYHQKVCAALNCKAYIDSSRRYCEEHKGYTDFLYSKTKPILWGTRKDD